VWLAALAYAAAAPVVRDAETTAALSGGWARDLGYERGNASDILAVAVTPKMSKAQRAIQKAQLAGSRPKAYEAFDALFEVNDLTLPELEAELSAYLSAPDSAHRDALLACLSDREIELPVGPLMSAVVGLLAAPDARTRRMAALTLASSGEVGETELGRGLDALSLDWAKDIRATLSLTA
jgi:hypothetical protein